MAAPDPFDCFVAPAQAGRGALRVIGGTIVIALVWLLWTVAALVGRVAYSILVEKIPPAQALESGQTLLAGGSPASLLAILSTFLGLWLGLWVALKLFHKRPFGALFSPERRIRWREFWAGAGLAAAFFVLSVAAALMLVGAPSPSGLAPAVWALWLIPVAVGVFFQATAEELLFRGYFLQQFAAWSRNPLVWAVLPSLFFGSLHLNPAESLQSNLMVGAITCLVGLIGAALVWRTGSISAAMGLHVGVNCQALALIGAEGSPLNGAQLWLYEAADATTLYAIDMASVIALLALILSPWCPVRAQDLGAPVPTRDQPAE